MPQVGMKNLALSPAGADLGLTGQRMPGDMESEEEKRKRLAAMAMGTGMNGLGAAMALFGK